MSSSRRERSRNLELARLQTGRFDHYEAEQFSIAKARKLLGADCMLSDQQLSELIGQLVALADVVVCAFLEQRKNRKTALSGQLLPMPTAAAPAVAVA